MRIKKHRAPYLEIEEENVSEEQCGLFAVL
jgi:hypothetical protein